jgi:hypothetical protein
MAPSLEVDSSSIVESKFISDERPSIIQGTSLSNVEVGGDDTSTPNQIKRPENPKPSVKPNIVKGHIATEYKYTPLKTFELEEHAIDVVTKLRV